MSERVFLRRAAAMALSLLLLSGLCACGSDEGGQDGTPKTGAASPAGSGEGQPAPAAVEAAPAAPQAEGAAPEPSPGPPLTPEERARAERVLDFRNAALSALEEGHYVLADVLFANAAFYLKTWRLPRRPETAGSRKAARARLRPEEGLFSDGEAARLTAALDDMDKALDALLGRYKALEAYVADESIRDDGARGKSLVRKLEAEHEVFMAARKTWLEIVEARAAEAEAALLREHPLQRQITAATAIFACFARTAAVLGAEAAPPPGTGPAAAGQPGVERAGAAEPSPAPSPGLDAAARAGLEAIHAELQARIAEAGRPPFAAAPELERRYRAFLKEATAYAVALDRGLGEGFFAPQRRELNVAAMRSRAAYNAFVRAANGVRAR